MKQPVDVLTLCDLAADGSGMGERLFGDSALGVVVEHLLSPSGLELMESVSTWEAII
jgi:hypothetical protein